MSLLILKLQLGEVQRRNLSLKECCQNREAHRQLRKEHSTHSLGILLSLCLEGTMFHFLYHTLQSYELAYRRMSPKEQGTFWDHRDCHRVPWERRSKLFGQYTAFKFVYLDQSVCLVNARTAHMVWCQHTPVIWWFVKRLLSDTYLEFAFWVHVQVVSP